MKIAAVVLPGIILTVLFCCNSNNRQGIKNEDPSKQENQINPDNGLKLIKSEEIGKDEGGSAIVKNYYEGSEQFVEVTIIEHISLKGKIVVLGDVGFTELAFVTDGNETFTFRNEFEKEYWTRQGKELIISGKVEKRKVINKETGKVLTKNWLYPESVSDL